MNKTKIDWADMTWNPVTGCLHGCEYCYARKIAQRFGRETPDTRCYMYPVADKDMTPYPWGFAPTLHTYRLAEPQKIKKPQNIFVCSMADLFGDWVPDEWIQTVFKACEAAPQHRYLFLTKNPSKWPGIFQAYGDKEIENWWFGQSAETLRPVEYVWAVPKHFLSIEPILSAPATELSLFGTSWIIVGAETGNRKGKVVPEKSWIDNIVKNCQQNDVPVFMKESLRSLMGDDFRQEFPWTGR